MSPHIYSVHQYIVQRLHSRAHTVTGAVTVTTFPSSINSSLALWQSSLTCASGIGRQARSCAIALGCVRDWSWSVVGWSTCL